MENIESPVPEHLQQIRDKVDRIADEVLDLKTRMSGLVSNLEAIQKQHVDLLRAVFAQAQALTQYVEVSQKQYADTSASLLAQNQVLEANYKQQAEISSVLIAQSKYLGQQGQAIGKIIARLEA